MRLNDDIQGGLKIFDDCICLTEDCRIRRVHGLEKSGHGNFQPFVSVEDFRNDLTTVDDCYRLCDE